MIISNTVAAAGSIFWSVLAQLLSVPILISCWGVEKYGGWLMLTVIPTYLALSDFGVGSVATAKMTALYSKNEYTKFNVVFQSALLFVCFISLCIITIIASSYFILVGWFEFDSANYFPATILVVYSLLLVISSVFLAAFRSVRQYTFGTVVYDSLQFLECIYVLFVAYFDGGYVEAASAMVLGRVFLLITFYFLTKKRIPFLVIGCKLHSYSELKLLTKPALGAVLVPVTLAINMQGMVLMAGWLLSPAAAAVLGPTRTITRIAIQGVGIVNRGSLPEFARSFALNDIESIKKIININLIAIAFGLLPGAVTIAFFGQWFVKIWSGGGVQPEFGFVVLMSISMLLHGIWFFFFNMLLSVNLHAKISIYIFLSAVLGLGGAFALVPALHLNGIAVALIISELISSSVVFFYILNITKKYHN